jgi:hypothetical protein
MKRNREILVSGRKGFNYFLRAFFAVKLIERERDLCLPHIEFRCARELRVVCLHEEQGS